MLFRLFFFFFISCLGYIPLAHAGMIDYPTVKLQALDKSTARTVTLEAKVGTTIEYGSIFIKIQSCRKSEPLDKPESASFLQIWEVPLNSNKSEWVFSGWMFASSPALSAMDHAVYDVWVLDCVDKDRENAEAKARESQKETANQEGLEKPKEADGTVVKEDESSKPRIVIEEEEGDAFINDGVENDDDQTSELDELIDDTIRDE